jgi:hypothetical protein
VQNDFRGPSIIERANDAQRGTRGLQDPGAGCLYLDGGRPASDFNSMVDSSRSSQAGYLNDPIGSIQTDHQNEVGGVIYPDTDKRFCLLALETLDQATHGFLKCQPACRLVRVNRVSAHVGGSVGSRLLFWSLASVFKSFGLGVGARSISEGDKRECKTEYERKSGEP